MAEVIALTAAAVQFLDVGGRVLVAFSSLCSSLKRVPAKVKAEIQQLEHVLIVLRTIETDIAVPNNGLATTLAGVLTQTQINEAKALLNDAVSQAKELEVILRSLVPPTQESTLRKAWRMIISQQKEEEILERCNGLEKVKSTIQLWQERCNYARLVLIEGHILAGRGFEDGVRSINQNIGAMSGELSAFKSSAANAHVTVKNELTAIQGSVYRTESSIQALAQYHQSYRDDLVQAVREECGRMGTTIVQQLVARPSLSRDLSAALEPVPTKHSMHHLPHRKRPILRSLVCTCRTVRTGASTGWQSITVYYVRRDQHQPDCHWHGQAGTSWTFGFQATVSAVLARSIRIALNMDFGAGGFAIAPVLSAVRVVDRAQSPAFAAVDAACVDVLQLCGVDGLLGLYSYQDYDFGKSLQMLGIYRKLYDDLRQLYSSGRASARDQTQEGITLLHCLISISLCIPDYSDRFIDSNRQIITLLDSCGTDFNAAYDSIFDKREASSALSDTIVPGVWRLEPRIRMRDAEKRSAIARDLIAYGCDMVVTSKHGGFLGGLVDACIADPGLVNDLLLGEVCLAAAKRSETHLRQLIANGHDVNRGFLIDNSNSILLTPVNFALEWSTGLQILFEAGADPSAIIEGSVPHIEDASVMALLLAYGYPIFPTTPNWELETLMHHALFSKTGMLDALVERLAHDRRQLMALASAQLSFDEQETIGLNAFGGSLGLLDRHAKSVIDALETRGVDVPAKIWPGHQKTVFHLADLTREGAQKLFAAGFRDVDAEDEDVYTPLTEACCSGEWGLVEWYLEKGADPRAVVKAGFINLPHLIAYTTAYRMTPKRAMQRSLSKFSTTCTPRTPDDCSCFCSVAGCLPAGIYIKRWSGPGYKADSLDVFIRSTTPDCVEAAYQDACRVEMFERLGMAHTCCRLEGFSLERIWPSKDEQLELREEDVKLKDILEAYMHLYHDLRSEYSGRFSLFWSAWWEAVSDHLPEDPLGRHGHRCRHDQLVSEEELERHEFAVGLGYEPDDEAIRTRMRDLLPLGFGVDPAEIFSDGVSNLFDG